MTAAHSSSTKSACPAAFRASTTAAVEGTTRLKWPNPVASPGPGPGWKAAAAAAAPEGLPPPPAPPLEALGEGVGAAAAGRPSASSGGASSSRRKLPGFRSVCGAQGLGYN